MRTLALIRCCSLPLSQLHELTTIAIAEAIDSCRDADLRLREAAESLRAAMEVAIGEVDDLDLRRMFIRRRRRMLASLQDDIGESFRGWPRESELQDHWSDLQERKRWARTAEQQMRTLWDAELQRGSGSIRALLDHDVVATGIELSHSGLAERLRRHLRLECDTKQHRQALYTAINFVTRLCCKPSPFHTFAYTTYRTAEDCARQTNCSTLRSLRDITYRDALLLLRLFLLDAGVWRLLEFQHAEVDEVADVDAIGFLCQPRWILSADGKGLEFAEEGYQIVSGDKKLLDSLRGEQGLFRIESGGGREQRLLDLGIVRVASLQLSLERLARLSSANGLPLLLSGLGKAVRCANEQFVVRAIGEHRPVGKVMGPLRAACDSYFRSVLGEEVELPQLALRDLHIEAPTYDPHPETAIMEGTDAELLGSIRPILAVGDALRYDAVLYPILVERLRHGPEPAAKCFERLLPIWQKYLGNLVQARRRSEGMDRDIVTGMREVEAGQLAIRIALQDCGRLLNDDEYGYREADLLEICRSTSTYFKSRAYGGTAFVQEIQSSEGRVGWVLNKLSHRPMVISARNVLAFDGRTAELLTDILDSLVAALTPAFSASLDVTDARLPLGRHYSPTDYYLQGVSDFGGKMRGAPLQVSDIWVRRALDEGNYRVELFHRSTGQRLHPVILSAAKLQSPLCRFLELFGSGESGVGSAILASGCCSEERRVTVGRLTVRRRRWLAGAFLRSLLGSTALQAASKWHRFHRESGFPLSFFYLISSNGRKNRGKREFASVLSAVLFDKFCREFQCHAAECVIEEAVPDPLSNDVGSNRTIETMIDIVMSRMLQVTSCC
jgi:hypothetical protein